MKLYGCWMRKAASDTAQGGSQLFEPVKKLSLPLVYLVLIVRLLLSVSGLAHGSLTRLAISLEQIELLVFEGEIRLGQQAATFCANLITAICVPRGGFGVERGNHIHFLDKLVVGRSGFEPLIFGVKGRCPRPLDERPTSCNSITRGLCFQLVAVLKG